MNSMDITDEIRCEEEIRKEIRRMCEYYEHIYQDLVNHIENKGLTDQEAKDWFHCLPQRFVNNYYPEEVDLIIDKCFKLLFECCIEKNLIDSKITYEEFYDGKGLYDEIYPISKWYKKDGPLGNLLD
nr:MAG TPA: hypothetical protein [Crassvirales sp.]